MQTYDPWKIQNTSKWAEDAMHFHRMIEKEFYKDYPEDFLAFGVWDFEKTASNEELLEYFVFEIDYGDGGFDHFESGYLTQEECLAKASQYVKNQFRYSSTDVPAKKIEDIVKVIFNATPNDKLFCIFELQKVEAWRLGIIMEDNFGKHIVAFARYEN